MKIFYFFLITLSALLIGCSSTSIMSNYQSREEFFKEYNKNSDNNVVTVTQTDGNSVTIDKKTELKNDTLYIVNSINDTAYYQIQISEIKALNYLSSDHKTADLLLQNGEKIKGENIYLKKDSIKFQGIKQFTVQTAYSSVNQLKEISYKNHWQGFVPGMFAGMILGGLIGATGWIYHPESDGNEPRQFEQNFAMTIGALVGIMIGPFVGYVIGYEVNFVFDQ